MTLAQVSTPNVYVWYSNIKVDKTVEIINYLHNEAISGKQIFYNIYSDAEISSDRTKANTGLFLFRGDKGAPFAIVNAGGGFMYVGAMHDSFPHSLELSKNKLNAFALIYRPENPYEDLARAIEFIHDNAATLGVKSDGYSLWGGSAGARMAAVLGNVAYLQQLTARTDLPQAASVIMQYTGYSYVSEYDAPTYVCVGKNDGIASWQTMQRRLQQLSSLGIPTEFHAYNGLSHGFGLGTGTVADGWINDAIKFWQNNIR
jgi:acetyl esterase/lipase